MAGDRINKRITKALTGYENTQLQSPSGMLSDAVGAAGSLGLALGWKMTKWGGKLAVGTAELGARLAVPVGGMVGSGIYHLSKAGLSVGTKIAGRIPYAKVGGAIADAGGSLISYKPERNILKPSGKIVRKSASIGLSGKGKLIVGAASLLAGSIAAAKEDNAYHMGQIDSRVQTATPDYAPKEYERHPTHSYMDNAGATGDLVFALNALRH